VLAATIAATAAIAQQVVGKATRDAFFLTHFSVSRLPLAMTAASVLSGAVVALVAQSLRRLGPALVAPRIFSLHAVLLLLECAFALRFERTVSAVVYLHTASFGATLLSVFWSLVSECFDPHTAKRALGRIGGGATLGGVLGGALGLGGSYVASLPVMLIVMAALSGICAAAVRGFTGGTHGAHAARSQRPPPASGLAALRNTPYLRLLALVVLGGALLQSLLDYALGAQAVAVFGPGARLLSFFAVFQTAVGLMSVVIQGTANRPALERLGLGGTLSLLPAVVGGVGAVAVAAPSLAVVAIQRGADGALRASLFRSAYEALFTPVPQSLKRATKTVIDVSFDRAGQLLGSGLTLVLHAIWQQAGLRAVTVATVVVAAAEVALTQRMQRGYKETLAARLRSGVLQIDLATIVDATTRTTVSRTLSEMDRKALLAKVEATRVAQLLERLTRDELAPHEVHDLKTFAPQAVGAIGDALLDEDLGARARLRAARLLRGVPSERSVQTLALGLDARAFEVRHACGRALADMRAQNPGLSFDASVMFARARRELESQSHDVRSMEHVFDVLSLAAPREAMQLAYGALQSNDAFLQGVALEYLEVALPADVRSAIMPRLTQPEARTAEPRPPGRSLDDLLRSKERIQLRLDELRRSQDPE
jgi:hypothetical protein